MMKRAYTILIIGCLMLIPQWAIANSEGTTEAASEAEQACTLYHKHDGELNRLYQAIVKKYEGDVASIRALQKAQKSWLQFRDNHIAMMFPLDRQGEDGNVPAPGSAMPMCRCIEMDALTVARNQQLNAILNPEEGDVCARF